MEYYFTHTNGSFKNYYGLVGGIDIPSGDDLKSSKYLIPGRYYCSNNDKVSTFKNCPIDVAFVLIVEYASGGSLSNYIRQAFYSYNNSKTVMRTYSSYNSTWEGDYILALKSDLDTKMAYTVGVADLNNAPYGNMIFVSTANAKNIPSGLNSNACMVFQNVAGERYRVQIAFSVASDKIAIRRMFNATTWQDDWKYFTAT